MSLVIHTRYTLLSTVCLSSGVILDDIPPAYLFPASTTSLPRPVVLCVFAVREHVHVLVLSRRVFVCWEFSPYSLLGVCVGCFSLCTHFVVTDVCTWHMCMCLLCLIACVHHTPACIGCVSLCIIYSGNTTHLHVLVASRCTRWGRLMMNINGRPHNSKTGPTVHAKPMYLPNFYQPYLVPFTAVPRK